MTVECIPVLNQMSLQDVTDFVKIHVHDFE